MAGQIWISVTVKHETRAAILCEHGMGKDQWVPKSQILDYSDDYRIGDTIEIEVPEWLAIEKGMV